MRHHALIALFTLGCGSPVGTLYGGGEVTATFFDTEGELLQVVDFPGEVKKIRKKWEDSGVTRGRSMSKRSIWDTVDIRARTREVSWEADRPCATAILTVDFDISINFETGQSGVYTTFTRPAQILNIPQDGRWQVYGDEFEGTASTTQVDPPRDCFGRIDLEWRFDPEISATVRSSVGGQSPRGLF